VRRVCLLGAIVVVLVGVATDSASATTWSGGCTMRGYTDLLKPSRFAPSQHGYLIYTKGTCTGSLDRRAYKGPGVLFVDGRMDRTMSCEGGYSTSVPGTLTFPRPAPAPKPRKAKKGKKRPPPPPPPPQVSLTVQEFQVLNQLPLEIGGAYSGLGYAYGSYPGNLKSIQACAGGGITKLDMKLNLSTVQELFG
jgi:hypothetical protein